MKEKEGERRRKGKRANMTEQDVVKQENTAKAEIPVIEMRDIVKKFGDFVANDHIQLKLYKGEVLAI